MSLYLEQGEISADQLHRRLKRRCAKGTWYRVFRFGAKWRRNPGAPRHLRETAAESRRGNPPLFIKGEGENAVEFRFEPDPKKYVLAHVFKVVMDPFMGKLRVFRVRRAQSREIRSFSSATIARPFQVGPCSCCREERTSRSTAPCRRHRGGGQGRRDRVRLCPARLARRRPYPHAPSGISDADARSR